MSSLLNKLERKIGKHAIKNLPMIMLIIYAVGYVMYIINPNIIMNMTLNPYEMINGGQWWRIVSWLLVPPLDMLDGTNIFFVLIILYFYYSIGMTMERTWGSFYFNVYIFSGIIWSIIGSFLFYAYVMNFGVVIDGIRIDAHLLPLRTLFSAYTLGFSTYYINMAIFLAYAVTYANATVLLFFVLPIKVGALGIIYGIILVLDAIQGWPYMAFIIGASLLNFIIFYFTTRKATKTRTQNLFEQVRKQREKLEKERAARTEKMKYRADAISKHRCAICGRTNDTNPELEFRFCSKCEGNYEYCQDHLFTHEHKKREL